MARAEAMKHLNLLKVGKPWTVVQPSRLARLASRANTDHSRKLRKQQRRQQTASTSGVEDQRESRLAGTLRLSLSFEQQPVGAAPQVLQHPALELPLADHLQSEPVGELLRPNLVIDRHAEHRSGVGELRLRVACGGTRTSAAR